MRVLVCGSRTWSDTGAIAQVLDHLKIHLIIQGGAKGADQCAKDYAEKMELPCLQFNAEWTRYGRAAGPMRNQRMLEEGRPDLVVAAHTNLEKSKGTKDMVKRAKKFGVPVRMVTEHCPVEVEHVLRKGVPFPKNVLR